MFSRWTYARVKAAENALDAGRIDEAFERARQLDDPQNARMQKLLDGVAAALLARARLAAQAGDDPRALADLGRLRQIHRLGREAEAFETRIRRRLDQLVEDRKAEPGRIRERYRLRDVRAFPLGLRFLLPEPLVERERS